MRIEKIANFASAMISIFLYLSLTITCAYFANKFWDRENHVMRGGRYAMPKFVFFVVLGISALFDLPSFIGCVAHGGPNSCVWNDNSYQFCWACHLLASCGYAFAIITPSILWSDIVQLKDGNFFNSASPLDSVKIFFRISFIVYCVVILVTIIGAIIYSEESNESSYSSSNDIGNLFSNCLTPIMLFVITVGCVWSGRRLQNYIRTVHLGTVTQMKIIRKLNFTMILIATTYGVRAMLVLSLYEDIPFPYSDFFEPTQYYPMWMVLTQWLPYIVCSYSLVNSMRFKEEGKPSNKKNNKQGVASTATTQNAKIDDGRNSPSKISRGGSAAGMPHTGHSFSIESGDTRSPFDHTLSNDSSQASADLEESAGHKTLDFLLTVASENDLSRSVFHHDNDDAELGTSPNDDESIDHFFTASAMQARGSTVASTQMGSFRLGK